jgi:hypothetical protein
MSSPRMAISSTSCLRSVNEQIYRVVVVEQHAYQFVAVYLVVTFVCCLVPQLAQLDDADTGL